jgi:hypothetical protein
MIAEPAGWGRLKGGAVLHHWKEDRPNCDCGAASREKLSIPGFLLAQGGLFTDQQAKDAHRAGRPLCNGCVERINARGRS